MKAVGVHKKVLGLFLVTVTVLTIMGVFLHLSLQDREAYRWVTHTYQVQTQLESTLLEIETGQDAHEDYCLNGNVEALGAFTDGFHKAFIELDRVERLVSDNPQQTDRLRKFRHDITVLHAALCASAKAPAPKVTPRSLVQQFALLDQVHRSADRMRQAEQDLLEERTRANRWSQRRVNIAVTCFLIVVSLLLVFLFQAVKQDLARERATERLRQAADQKVVGILENISDAFFALNQDWVVTYMNGQAEQMLEKPRAEVVGQNLWKVYPGAEDQEFGRAYRRALQEQVTVRFESYDASRDCWFELWAYPNDDGLGIFVSNINERKLTEEERNRLVRQEMLHNAAQRRNQELQDLARRLVEMQEAERGHLAHELHEEVSQVLAGLNLSLASILKQEGANREEQIRTAQQLVADLMRQVRALSLDLRPGVLDDLGLEPALKWYCKRYTEQNQINVEFHAEGIASRLDGTVETTAYRIVQEALTNVAHHSEVEAVAVHVTLQEEHLLIQVTDQRVGLSLENANCFCDHSSLTGMLERASLIGGTFEVTTGSGKGMRIVARLPIHPVYTSLES